MENAVALRWTDWSGDPVILSGLVAAALAYLRICRRFPPRGRQPLYFWAGLLVLAGALLSPLDAGAEYLFTLHMSQHMLLLLVAPPLLALAVPSSLLGWMYQRPPLRRALRALWAPVPAFLLFNGVLLLWHLPAAYDATLRVTWIHAAEHLSFVGAGLVFWGVIVSPAPIFVRASLGLKLAMLVGADVVNFVLGFALAFAGRPFYAPYTTVARLWRMAPLDDLRLGGAVMWVMGQMMYAIPVLILINIILWRDGGRAIPGRPSGQPPTLISPTR
ncbi:MAG TPA: cytochrome c oxidase assembly protein [bacterium]|nr:cytochrome c oxidase assembly protein [bacterium]